MNKYLIKLADHLDKKGLHKEADYVDWVLKKYSQELDSDKVKDKFSFLCNRYAIMFDQVAGSMSFLSDDLAYSMWENVLDVIKYAAASVDEEEVRDQFYSNFNDLEIEELKQKLVELSNQLSECIGLKSVDEMYSKAISILKK